MKKKLFLVCTLAVAMLALASCSNSSDSTETSSAQVTATTETTQPAATPAPSQAAETAQASETPQASQSAAPSESTKPAESASTSGSSEAKPITPMSSGIDVNDLSECTVPVSFSAEDVDTDAQTITVTVYSYDLYDMRDISTMSVGDTITICQEKVTITSLEQPSGSSQTLINGGADNGGYTLTSSEEDGIYAIGDDDSKLYYSVGTKTLPIAGSFTLTDESDLDKGTTIYTADQIAAGEAGGSFNEMNTTITTMSGSVVSMNRVYIP